MFPAERLLWPLAFVNRVRLDFFPQQRSWTFLFLRRSFYRAISDDRSDRSRSFACVRSPLMSSPIPRLARPVLFREARHFDLADISASFFPYPVLFPETVRLVVYHPNAAGSVRILASPFATSLVAPFELHGELFSLPVRLALISFWPSRFPASPRSFLHAPMFV